jgi:hypothetical protein
MCVTKKIYGKHNKSMTAEYLRKVTGGYVITTEASHY